MTLAWAPHPPTHRLPTAHQVVSLKEADFFFDSLRQMSDWAKKNRPQKEGEGTRDGWVELPSRATHCTPGSVCPLGRQIGQGLRAPAWGHRQLSSAW